MAFNYIGCDISSKTAYLSQDFRRVHFGLDNQKEVTCLTVRFPNGIVRAKEKIPADQIVTIQE